MLKIWPRDTILIKGEEDLAKRYYPVKGDEIWPRDTILIKGDVNLSKKYYPH